MRKRILISGGAGFVGRTLTRILYAEHDVCVVDTLQFGPERLRSLQRASFRLECIDICDAVAVKSLIENFDPDIIIHLAAIHFIPLCEQDPGKAIATNVVGTANLLAACPPGRRFVFASSGAVYSPSEQPHDEHHSEIGPRDIYGHTKLQGEEYVRYFAASRPLAAVVVRLFNVVGPGETNPHLLPEIIAQLKAGHERIRLGNLWPKRDYIHVSDAAEGFAAAALNGSIEAGETVTVNLATSRQYSVEEILQRLRRVTGLPITVVADTSRMRSVDRPFLSGSTAAIQCRFGWTPRYDIEDVVADLWRDPDLTAELSKRYSDHPVMQARSECG